MKVFKELRFDLERDLYNEEDIIVDNCQFQGPNDGESALKECRNVEVINSLFDLRYPMWHDTNISLKNITMTENARAALWYSNNINISYSNLNGIKALRECKNIIINNSNIKSEEFFWKNDGATINNSQIEAMYGFLMSNNLKLNEIKFTGKYSFQYVNNLEINNSYLDTKDAFWHAKNVIVKDSVVKGEYLGWYSENVTFINCLIKGTQPLCYAKNLKLINCRMEDADLAFEYSEVEADIKGHIISIKNPSKGHIVCDTLGELIEGNSVYPLNCTVDVKNKNKES